MPDDSSVIPAALAKALSDKLYDKQRAATLKIERLVVDALDADDEQKIYKLITELSTDFATSEKEAARIGGLVALAATAVALTHINIRPFLPHMVPPMVSALSDGESKVRYFACESLYNVAKVSRGYILRWFNDIFDGLARVTADSVKTVKDGADYLDRLVKDIVAEQAATCLDWYESNSQGDPEADVRAGVDGDVDLEDSDNEHILDTADGVLVSAPRRGSTGTTNTRDPMFSGAISTTNGAEDGENPEISQQLARHSRTGPRMAFSLEKFVPLLAERMHTYKPSTRLYLIEWIRVLDSVPGLDMIVYLPEFFDGLLRFLSDPNDDVRNRTQSLLGELLSEIRECVELQGFDPDGDGNGDGPALVMSDDIADDDSMMWGGDEPGVSRVSRARVRSSTLQSDVHAEGRFADDPPRYSLGFQGRGQQQGLAISRRPSRAPSAAGSISSARMGPISGSVPGLAPFYHNYGSNRPNSRSGSRSHLHARTGSNAALDGSVSRSAASIMSSALASGQLHGMPDELRMAARRKKIRAERATNALVPGAGVMIDFARCVNILIPHLESNDQEIQGTALGWILQFTWLCPQVIVRFVPRLVNAVLPSVSHPMPTHRHTAEDVNQQLYDLVNSASDPTRRIVEVLRQRTVDDAKAKQQKPAQGPSSGRVSTEPGARPLASRPLPPVTSTTTAAVGGMTRPQSPSLSTYSVTSASAAPIAVRSRAGSLLQATTGSPAPSSLAATPALQPADKGSALQSRPQSPPTLPPAGEAPQQQQSMHVHLNAASDSPVLSPAQNEPLSSRDDTNEVGDSTNAFANAKEDGAAASDIEGLETTTVIDEPFNYEHAATAVMELFAKNVHEPTKVAGMQWLLLLHRKAPWRILTPEDMSFPVLLKMLSDSSEQVVKLDLELFAQISLYSQRQEEQKQSQRQEQQQTSDVDSSKYSEVDPRSTPYLSRFLGSLLQMFATDRVLLETRAALMVRQLCVVLDPQLVFCLFARLLTLPRFTLEANDSSPMAYHRANTDAGDDAGYGMPTEGRQHAKSQGFDAGFSDYESDALDDADIPDQDAILRDGSDPLAGPGGTADNLVDLEFVSIMVQHLSWILVTAPETEKLRLILRRYNVGLAAHAHAPQLASVHDAIASTGSRPMSRSTANGVIAVSGADRGRRSSPAISGAVRRRGGSTTGTAPVPGVSAVASAAESQSQSQQKPSKLVRAATGTQAPPAPSTSVQQQQQQLQGMRSNRAGGVADPEKPRVRGDKDPRTQSQSQSQSQSASQRQSNAAVQTQKARNVLFSAVRRIEQDIEQNEESHRLFVSLFRAWSYNPAACLTLCLLSQHYEIGAELITAFGQLTQDMTVSFLVQLDKLVQLIESPVFTYLRLQLLDPMQYPLLVRTLYGLLMMLPQSSAFAILRNRLSTVAMLPFGSGLG
ncbi:hypothetical protein GGI15_002942, partial [Coemansia interrupta]